MDSVFKRPCFQSHDETTVIVWFNESEFVKVGRQKLIYSSLYFKCILTSNFRDRNSEFVEVKYPTSFETFKIAIDFANCYHIGQNDENNFEVFQLADYLQFDLLKKKLCQSFHYWLEPQKHSSEVPPFENLKFSNWRIQKGYAEQILWSVRHANRSSFQRPNVLGILQWGKQLFRNSTLPSPRPERCLD